MHRGQRDAAANASASNVTPEGDEPYTLQDPIYGQPSGPVMSRADRTTREEIIRRRLTPEDADATLARMDAERADAERARAERAEADRARANAESTGSAGTGSAAGSDAAR